ncbi:hypothetical protein [Flocculibacter collagenilyticus]|uniref:hypothetical protein n=1 Tax=Flocculibacter collagenilyticus TaxID=2744479 RepID=UPI0018F67214|nr:hypothetical protein [Flocculibacter collagenilyticus]
MSPTDPKKNSAAHTEPDIPAGQHNASIADTAETIEQRSITQLAEPDPLSSLLASLETLWQQYRDRWVAGSNLLAADCRLSLRALASTLMVALAFFAVFTCLWIGVNVFATYGLIQAGLHWTLTGLAIIGVNTIVLWWLKSTIHSLTSEISITRTLDSVFSHQPKEESQS